MGEGGTKRRLAHEAIAARIRAVHRSLLVVVVLTSFAIATGCNCGKKPVLNMDNPALGLSMQTLDFGAVPEGQMKDLTATIQNNGRAPMNLDAVIAADGSTDFTLGPVPATVPANGQVSVVVHFIPTGSGSDTAEMVVTTNDPDRPTETITLLGGPIQPELKFEPDPVTFNGAVVGMNNIRNVTIHSVGQANLHVMALGVAQNGNPDFSFDPSSISLPVTLPPDASVDLMVVYAPFQLADAGPGWLQADSDDPMHLKQVELIPSQFAECADGIDNDNDGLIDYPDDPGCADSSDDDEYNPPSCVNGAMQYCGSNVGACSQGVRQCVGGNWSPCDGGVRQAPETCDGLDNDCNGVSDDGITMACGMNACAGVEACIPDSGVAGGQWGQCAPLTNPPPEMCDGMDNNCDGTIDNGISQACVATNGCAGVQNCVPGGTGQWTTCAQNDPMCGQDAGTIDGGCNPNGLFTLDAGSISYSCTFGIVSFDITQFQIQTNGQLITVGPQSPGDATHYKFTGSSNAYCPGGSFTATLVYPGTCTETYTVTGTFVNDYAWTGTFTSAYQGTDCTGFGDDCIGQTWNISAGR